MSNGFVYFILEKETRNIKIGFSENNPKERLKSLQTGNSNELTLIGFIEGSSKDETRLQHEFSLERIRRRNEWFKPSSRLRLRIKELLEGSIEDKKSGIEFLNQEINDGQNIVHGTDTFPDESKYIGEMKDGLPIGQGTFTWSDGRKYVGKIKDGLQNGQGTFTWSDGRKYVGKFKDGIKNGQGTETWTEIWEEDDEGDLLNHKRDSKYVGKFKDGMKNGKGTETWTEIWEEKGSGGEINTFQDDKEYVGEFKDGMKNGQGTLTESDGRKYVGKFKDGKKNGLGTETHFDEIKLTTYITFGNWVNGEQLGYVIHNWDDVDTISVWYHYKRIKKSRNLKSWDVVGKVVTQNDKDPNKTYKSIYGKWVELDDPNWKPK